MRTRLVDLRPVDVTGVRTRVAGVSDEPALQTLFVILNENVLCSMSTVTAGQRAHINTAYFCFSEELVLYFLSHPDSLHCRNLAKNSSMAVSVFSSSQKWTDPGRGIQLFGRCNRAEGEESLNAERLYANRFPAYLEWRRQRGGGDLALAYRFYSFVAENVKILEEREFGDAVFVEGEVNREANDEV